MTEEEFIEATLTLVSSYGAAPDGQKRLVKLALNFVKEVKEEVPTAPPEEMYAAALDIIEKNLREEGLAPLITVEGQHR
jgi:hypothetical protein